MTDFRFRIPDPSQFEIVVYERDLTNLLDYRPFSFQEKGPGDEFVAKKRVFPKADRI
jgi:hypothetical protein